MRRGDAFAVALSCSNCGHTWQREFPAETRVAWDETQQGVTARDTTCEVLGMHCDCCETLVCPVCELRAYADVLNRHPIEESEDDGVTTITPTELIQSNRDEGYMRDVSSQDPLLESFYEDVVESGHEAEVENERRGCGHLQHNATYVRSDVHALSSDEGEIPRFVELDQPVEYREYGDRGAIIPGYKKFPGIEFGLAYVNEGKTTTPADELQIKRAADGSGETEWSHLQRLAHTLRFDGEHYGEITSARAHDLLMSVGASHWPEPEDYIEETRRLGLNLKVPASQNRDPPVVNPLRTRCWVVHPNGCGDGRAGIIGYAVLTRTIYTTGADSTATDPDVPTYAEEWADTGKVDLVTPGEPVESEAEEKTSPDAEINEFVEGDA